MKVIATAVRLSHTSRFVAEPPSPAFDQLVWGVHSGKHLVLKEDAEKAIAAVSTSPPSTARPYDSTGAMAAAWFGTNAGGAVERVFDTPASVQPNPTVSTDTQKLVEAMQKYLTSIEHTLTLPAAEYIPAVGDAFYIIKLARATLSKYENK